MTEDKTVEDKQNARRKNAIFDEEELNKSRVILTQLYTEVIENRTTGDLITTKNKLNYKPSFLEF